MAFSIRFSATRTSSSRSPATTTGRGAVDLERHAGLRRQRRQRVGDVARPPGRGRPACRAADAGSARCATATAGRRRAAPCAGPARAMMARKRARAAASSRAGPCSVSTKPSSEASGVRSSWLALATKSARIRSTRRASVRSRKVTAPGAVLVGRARAAPRDVERRARPARGRARPRSRPGPEPLTRRIASRMSGSRSARASAPSIRSAGSMAFARRLAATTRASPQTTITRSGQRLDEGRDRGERSRRRFDVQHGDRPPCGRVPLPRIFRPTSRDEVMTQRHGGRTLAVCAGGLTGSDSWHD